MLCARAWEKSGDCEIVVVQANGRPENSTIYQPYFWRGRRQAASYVYVSLCLCVQVCVCVCVHVYIYIYICIFR